MLSLDGEPLAESFLGRERKGELYLPVCGVAEALSLAISCSDNRAYGFVLSESRPFVADLEEGFAVSVRAVYPIGNKAFPADNDIYVEIHELSRWLPVDLTLDANSSTIKVLPREDLPVQGFKKRQRLAQPKPLSVPKQLPDMTPARRALSPPTADFAAQVRLSGEKQAAMQTSTWTSIDVSGDVLYMSNETHLFVEDDKLKRLDASLSRRSVSGFAAGPLKMAQVTVGAAQAPYIDGIGASARPMYGFLVSNRPIFGSSNFLTHDVNGYLPAGWDAELFHNGVQVGYQPPTEEGMYHFQNLRVYYGINSFKVILHGPFGERRESEELFANDATTPKGDFFYTVSAGWQTGLTYKEIQGLKQEFNQTVTTDFGITRGLTGSALLVRHQDDRGSEREYVGVGLRSAVRYTLLSLDLIQSFRPEDGGSGQMLTVKSSSRDVLGLNLEVVQRLFNNFDSPQFPRTDDPLLSRTVVKGNSSFSILDRIRIPFSMDVGVDTRRSGAVESTFKGRISGGWNGWNGTLEGDLSYLNKTVNATSSLQISTRLKDANLRGQAVVALEPDFHPLSIDVSADKELGRGYQLNSGLLHDTVNDISSLRMGLSKRYGLLGYSLSASVSTKGEYSVNAGIRSSLGVDSSTGQLVASAEPLSPYGMIAVRATVWENGGEKPVQAVGFLVNGSNANIIKGSNGEQIIAYLQPDLPVDVSVDLATVDDPFMVPIEEGCRIVPRAGVVAICKFSMTSGGEIDGMVWARLKQSGEVPVKGVRVDLLVKKAGEEKLLASTRTEESGYFLFKSVKPGNYTIVIPDAEVARLKAAAVEPLEVSMPAGGDMVSGQNFYLLPAVSAPGVTLRPPAEKMFE